MTRFRNVVSHSLLMIVVFSMGPVFGDTAGIEFEELHTIEGNFASPGRGSKLVFDKEFAFLASDGGLFRGPRSLHSPEQFDLVAFKSSRINGIHVYDDTLYILKHGEETVGEATDHTFLLSKDHATAFTPADEGLEKCIGNYCRFLGPSHMVRIDSAILLNAGGGPNLIATKDAGKSWSILSGSLNTNQCYFQAVANVGLTVFVGGECPLDHAYLRAGVLDSSLSTFMVPLEDVSAPNLQNRMIQFIAAAPVGRNVVFAGTEGGVLRSTDNGETWSFVLRYAHGGLEGRDDEPGELTYKYPYPHHIVFNPRNSQQVVIAGFDKGAMTSFLAYSHDSGETWTEVTKEIPELAESSNAFVLTLSPDEELVLGLVYDNARALKLGVVTGIFDP